MKAISFEDVSFAYEENFLFEHLNFEVEEGEFVAFSVYLIRTSLPCRAAGATTGAQ